MNTVVIRADSLGKQYHLGGKRFRTLRETLSETASRLRNRAGKPRRKDTIWALKDVSFSVGRGEIVGIIGSNGAGKSTLLKILSRITEPTEGWAEISGRVGSLLEVGAGFHMELTGRENIYLSGAILGMKKREIDRKFDEIVAFSEVAPFIDTPVKHYSSGMYVRLAFSVAAHMEPDVLLVDEVLAVGDARFWSKSIDKMRRLNAEGMTIVLVTHELFLIQTVCDRAMLIDHGEIVIEGQPLTVIAAYREMNRHPANGEDRPSGVQDEAVLSLFQVVPDGSWETPPQYYPDSGVTFLLEAQVPRVYPKVRFRIRVTGPDSVAYFTLFSPVVDVPTSGLLECRASISRLMLVPGDYVVWAGLCTDAGEHEALAERHLPFFVNSAGELDNGPGVFWNRASWDVRSIG